MVAFRVGLKGLEDLDRELRLPVPGGVFAALRVEIEGRKRLRTGSGLLSAYLLGGGLGPRRTVGMLTSRKQGVSSRAFRRKLFYESLTKSSRSFPVELLVFAPQCPE